MKSVVWTVASLPFFISGALCLAAALWGMWKVGEDKMSKEKDDKYLFAAFVCIIIAMMTLPLGAWMVS